jgi:TonB family protein
MLENVGLPLLDGRGSEGLVASDWTARCYNRVMKAWKTLSAGMALSFLTSFSIHASDVQLLRAPSMPESKIVTRVQPDYPGDAADLRIHGVVKMTVVIGTNGRVESARLLSGHRLLAPAALQAARKWVFEPTEVQGKPVRVATEIDIPFNLDAYGRPVELKATSAAPQL